MKKVTVDVLKEKVKFINQYGSLTYKLVFKQDKDGYFLIRNYGLDGSDVLKLGNESEINNSLNAIMKQQWLSEDWKKYKGSL